MGQRLDFMKQLAHGFADHFGKTCEIVIHDLTKKDPDHSIVYIVNGHITGRKIGDGPSSVVLEAMSKSPDKIKDRISYLTRTSNGHILKSSTFFVRGDDEQIEYILSVNYDITSVIDVLNSIICTDTDKSNPQMLNAYLNVQAQPIVHNVNDLLDTLIEQALTLVGKPVDDMNKDDKIRVVQFLNDAGAFLITKSGDKVSSLLNISKFTLYNYMDAGNKIRED